MKAKKMKLTDIKISNSFARTIPNEEKLHKCYQHWIETHKQDRDIVINHKGYLVDGYVQYIILMELGEEYALVNKLPKYTTAPTTYIWGKHPNSIDNKTYVWRVPSSWNDWINEVQIGDSIYCHTKNGVASVIVQEVEVLNNRPINRAIKKVATKRIKRS